MESGIIFIIDERSKLRFESGAGSGSWYSVCSAECVHC